MFMGMLKFNKIIFNAFHHRNKLIWSVSELIVNTAKCCHCSLYKSRFSSESLPDTSEYNRPKYVLIMPKEKKLKLNVSELLHQVRKEQNRKRSHSRSKSRLSQKRCKLVKHKVDAVGNSLAESSRINEENSDSDIAIVFDSKAAREREAEKQIITLDSDEDKDSNNMGNANSASNGMNPLSHGSSLQTNSWQYSISSHGTNFQHDAWLCSATPPLYFQSVSAPNLEVPVFTENEELEIHQPKQSDEGTSAEKLQQEGRSEREKLKKMRQWKVTRFGSSVTRIPKATSYQLMFTIMSYNVLAQDLIYNHPELYHKHDSRALEWEYRSQVLLNEFREANADILCLQEVQASHLDTFYHELKNLGYDGIYKQRTGNNVDGVAIYYKRDKFQLSDHTTVEYYQPGIDILDRNNVGLIAKLSIKVNPSKHIVVATTHLLFNPRRHDIKLAQIQLLLAEVERFAFQSFRFGTAIYWPVMITGDMNFEPYTGVYQLLTEGMFQYEGLCNKDLTSMTHGRILGKELLPPALNILDTCQHWGILCKRLIEKIDHTSELKLLKIYNTDHRKIMSDLNMTSEIPTSFEYFVESAKVMGLMNNFLPYFGPSTIPAMPEAGYGTGQLTHNLNLCSAYEHDEQYTREEVTTKQGPWLTVDYIFYSCHEKSKNKVITEGSLNLVSRFGLLTYDQADSLGPIPNLASPSDHYPLLAKFLLKF